MGLAQTLASSRKPHVLPCQGRGRGFESLRPLQNSPCPAEITKNFSIPWSESGSECRFVLVDFTHMNAAGRLRVYKAGNRCTVRRAVAHAAAKRGLVGRENGWALSAMIDR
jgi:hypothetical protein